MTLLGAEGLLSDLVEGHLSFKSQSKFSNCLSTKYQLMQVSLRSFCLQIFDSRVLCKVCLPRSAVLDHATLMRQECPSVAVERLTSGVGNEQLAETEELHPHLSGRELSL